MNFTTAGREEGGATPSGHADRLALFNVTRVAGIIAIKNFFKIVTLSIKRQKK